MPDAPDWYRFLPGSERHILGDLGEHAVRVGSPVVYDRRGEMVYANNGDTGLSGLMVFLAGTGAAVIPTAEFSLTSGYGLKFIAGSTDSNKAQIVKTNVAPEVSSMGLEVALALLTAWYQVQINLVVYSTDWVRVARVRIRDTEEDVAIKDSDGNYYSIIDTGELDDSWGVFHHLKLVVDFDTGKWDRIMFDEVETDISTYTLEASGASTFRAIQWDVGLYGREGYNDEMVVGRVVLTANEP